MSRLTSAATIAALGSWSAEAELERIAWVEADITDRANVQRALEQHAVGSVIHLAALQAPFCRADPPWGRP